MPFRPLKFLLILGVIFGFGSGFASIARHHRGECHGGWGGRGYYGEVQEAPVSPAAPVVQAPAPVQQQQQTAPGAQSAPVIVQAPVAQPAPVIVIIPPSNSSPTVVTTPSNNNVAPSPAPAKE